MIDDDFKRWKYGPVIPSVYHELKPYGYFPVTRKISSLVQMPGNGVKIVTPEIDPHDKDAIELIDQIAVNYEVFRAGAFSNDTCTWCGMATGPDNGSTITPDEMMNNIFTLNEFSG
ncbi:type II toxin-antitoxin system antitoxin SocA domain-containing protein [Escherichia coli]